MALVPPLRVVATSDVIRHEEVDPLRVEQLVERIRADRTLVNPVVCTEVDGRFVVLDGATRTEAVRALGLEHLVVQVVDTSATRLETWHHVIRDTDSTPVIDCIAESIVLTPDTSNTPLIRTHDGHAYSASAPNRSANSLLSDLVASYIGRWTVSRIIDATPEVVASRFPDWSVIVEFPTVEPNQVIQAALSSDLLPAGITRFLIPERILRVNVDLDLLEGADNLEARQAALDRLIQLRSEAGRVRRYEETVVILDD